MRSARLLGQIRGQLEDIRGLKTKLTSIAGVSREVGDGLDRMRDAVIGKIVEAEAELRAATVRNSV